MPYFLRKTLKKYLKFKLRYYLFDIKYLYKNRHERKFHYENIGNGNRLQPPLKW